MDKITARERFEGCIIGGAIGDALGSLYENQEPLHDESKIYYPFGKPLPAPRPTLRITDDTQLTLATCEAIAESEGINPAFIAQKFVQLYKHRITGLGASTLKAIRELELGGHWLQVGRKGEYAAGNGAAMRIAPLAYVSKTLNRQQVEEISKITHHNDEAYTGALCVVLSIQAILQGKWTGNENIFELLIQQVPDTKVRDRLIEINSIQEQATIQSIAKQFGSRGYVVESVPLAIFAASKVLQIGLEKMFDELIAVAGDTDSNCSIAGQIAGSLLGKSQISLHLLEKLKTMDEYNWIQETIHNFISHKNFCY